MTATQDSQPRVRADLRRGIAYASGQVIVRGDEAYERLSTLAGAAGDDPEVLAELGPWRQVAGITDPLLAVEQLRAEGYVAQPNHVWTADACGSACGPHPALGPALLHAVANPLMANPLMANPLMANPLMANPLMANPLMANPLMANPLMANPLMANKPPESSAKPAVGRELPKRALPVDGTPPVIAVLDSGLAATRPDLLTAAGNRVSGEDDHPDVDLVDWEGTTHPADGWLDPVAGHGTFIAGIIEQLAPGCRVHVGRVLTPFGDADEVTVAAAIQALARGTTKGFEQIPDILVLSLGGPALESPFLLRSAVAEARAAGIVVVASAGNSGTCTPHFPAALPEVIAVGALGPGGPAPYSNYGEWVDACAPGTDLVSTFFPSFDGNYPAKNSVDVDDFAGWARWTGTSFAAPVVGAAIAREMVLGDCAASEAAVRIVDAPHLMRIPCLGTVVNI